MSKLEGKVAFITGAARGQGRSHAVRLAEDGADIVAVDLCADVDTVPYPLGTADELAETAKLVEAAGRRCATAVADIRSLEQLGAAVDLAKETFGQIDILVSNAGIWSGSTDSWSLDEETWQTMIDINLTGQWKTAKAVVPTMIEGGSGGAITITSSSIGLKATTGNVHYTSAKHGVIGLVRTLAHELAPHNIRVNAVCPTTVNSPMITNDALYSLFRPDLESPSLADAEPGLNDLNLLDVTMMEPAEVSAAISWLVSDDARYVTGIALPVDAGSTAK
ncbi:MAG TPA: mycofactocin-coupled SDR family oxidoreductase [Solirubrobacterales bacterium]|jgi:(+)-trans-carveol dehydrogenase|nr:mycofactocin-coupled SDR family oxidoreductase [Solirubrobacterales bacterium]